MLHPKNTPLQARFSTKINIFCIIGNRKHRTENMACSGHRPAYCRKSTMFENGLAFPITLGPRFDTALEREEMELISELENARLIRAISVQRNAW